jgi:hypothetical protein
MNICSRWQRTGTKDKQYKPDFKEGDLLFVWGRAAKDARLEGNQRLEPGKGRMPSKLKPPWQGPFPMVRWKNERTCVLNRNGKEVEFNVNRLKRQDEWDESHPDTSGILEESARKKLSTSGMLKEPAQKKARIEKAPEDNAKDGKPTIGQTIIFPHPIAKGHRSPFGILEVRKMELCIINGEATDTIPTAAIFYVDGLISRTVADIMETGLERMKHGQGFIRRNQSTRPS